MQEQTICGELGHAEQSVQAADGAPIGRGIQQGDRYAGDDYSLPAGCRRRPLPKGCGDSVPLPAFDCDRHLQLMEQHGLLRREPVPQDGRLKRLVLTDKALALDARIKKKFRDTETLMRAGISEEDMDAWFRVCGRIRANLENYQRRASEGQE